MPRSRRAFWAHEPADQREDGWLLSLVGTLLAPPTYAFAFLLARLVPDYPAEPGADNREPRYDPRGSQNRSARVVAWFVTSSRRSTFYKRAHRVGHRCHFIPSCGEYFVLAVEKHGLWRGLWKAGARLRRCRPAHFEDYLDFP